MAFVHGASSSGWSVERSFGSDTRENRTRSGLVSHSAMDSIRGTITKRLVNREDVSVFATLRIILKSIKEHHCKIKFKGADTLKKIFIFLLFSQQTLKLLRILFAPICIMKRYVIRSGEYWYYGKYWCIHPTVLFPFVPVGAISVSVSMASHLPLPSAAFHRTSRDKSPSGCPASTTQRWVYWVLLPKLEQLMGKLCFNWALGQFRCG